MSESTLTVGVSTVYALSMAKYVCVRLKGQANEVRVKADKVEEDGPNTILKLGDQQVGRFAANEVQGWFIIDDGR